VIFSDEFNHGSIVDGCRLTKAKKVVFKHGDCSDLRQKIKENNLPNKLIVTEGVFTPEGELTDIPEFVKVAKETGSKLMIDDAHGIGVLGENGGGSIQHFGCEKDVDIIMGSMDKAFGGIGGYLCGKKELIKYLRVSARSSLLSSSYPAAMAGAMLATVKEIRGSSERREELFAKAKLLRDALKDLGFKIMGNYDLPAIPLFIGDENKALEFNKILWEKGIYGMVFRWPAVPMKKARMRITVMHGHSEENIKSFVGACKIAGKKTGLIS
jgi:glycine C-acetyltransferase